jgi:hypothetical protein
MKEFNLQRMLVTVDSLSAAQSKLVSARAVGGGAATLPDEKYKALIENVEFGKQVCEEAKFTDSWHKIHMSLSELNSSVMDISSLQTELRNIGEAILVESAKFKFLRVSRDRANYVDNHLALFGPSVVAAFPSAVPDMREAGNCLAAECNTAAVFHLMRTVEWGLRALCADVGLIRLKSKTKGGKIKYTPISYTDWEHMLSQLQARIDVKLNRIKRGKLKQDAQEFYYPALQDIRGIRDAWRNHVMHTRAEYNHQDADAILRHVERLLTTLAKRIREE